MELESTTLLLIGGGLTTAIATLFGVARAAFAYGQRAMEAHLMHLAEQVRESHEEKRELIASLDERRDQLYRALEYVPNEKISAVLGVDYWLRTASGTSPTPSAQNYQRHRGGERLRDDPNPQDTPGA